MYSIRRSWCAFPVVYQTSMPDICSVVMSGEVQWPTQTYSRYWLYHRPTTFLDSNFQDLQDLSQLSGRSFCELCKLPDSLNLAPWKYMHLPEWSGRLDMSYCSEFDAPKIFRLLRMFSARSRLGRIFSAVVWFPFFFSFTSWSQFTENERNDFHQMLYGIRRSGKESVRRMLS
jgi:hypothetical protein